MTGILRIYPIIVGVGKYAAHTQQLKLNLPGPLTDVEKIYKGFKNGNDAFTLIEPATILVDKSATSGNVRDALRTKSRGLRRNDLLFFYFAGHGYVHVRDRVPLLLCHNVDVQDPNDGSIRLDYLLDFMQDSDKLSSEASMMIVLDACSSGAIVENDIMRSNISQSIESIVSKIILKSQGNRSLFVSSHSDQESYEGNEGGYFTTGFTKGWFEGLARQSDGKVTPQSLSVYLHEYFEGYAQKPVTAINASSILVLGQFEIPFSEAPQVSNKQIREKPWIDIGGAGSLPVNKKTTEDENQTKDRQKALQFMGIALAVLVLTCGNIPTYDILRE